MRIIHINAFDDDFNEEIEEAGAATVDSSIGEEDVEDLESDDVTETDVDEQNSSIVINDDGTIILCVDANGGAFDGGNVDLRRVIAACAADTELRRIMQDSLKNLEVETTKTDPNKATK